MHHCVADTVSIFMPDPVFKSDCFINFDDVMQFAASGCIDIDMLYVMLYESVNMALSHTKCV